MKKQVFWIALIILIGAILFLFYFNFCSTDRVEVETREVHTEIREADYQRLRDRIVSLERKLLELENKINQHTSAKTTTTRSVTQAKPAPTPEPRPEPKTVRADDKKADLSHLRNVSGDIIFCVMANNDGGMHFPQYALERGATFEGNVRSNTTSDGNNWVVHPTETMRGDYGITHDGTFFVSHSVIDSLIDVHNLAIKSEFTGWQPRDMTREGNYWVYKTR